MPSRKASMPVANMSAPAMFAAGMMVVRTLTLQIVGVVLYVALMTYAAWTTRKARDAGPRLVIAG